MVDARNRALWLPDVLRNAGLTVQVVDGWATRGKDPQEWLCQVFHHTASSRNAGNTPALGICTNGRGGSAPVPGPLCNALVARDGTWFVVAAGAANHPGVSQIPDYKGGDIGSGVKYYSLGWECENDGMGEPWPSEQIESIEIGEAAVASYLGWETCRVWGHKEIAVPHGRKIDPAGINMDHHRSNVDGRMSSEKEPFTVAQFDEIKAALAAISREQSEQGAILDKLNSDYLTKGKEVRQVIAEIDKRTSDLVTGKRPSKGS